MSNKDKQNQNSEIESLEEMQLDDSRRIKVLSPGMLVFRRFIRNKLAVVGLVILLFMFSFAFLGTVFTPYGQAQVFKGIDGLVKDYLGATYNSELRYTVADGEEFGNAKRSQFLLSLGKEELIFDHDGITYLYIEESEDFYRIVRLDLFAEDLLGNLIRNEGELSDEFVAAYKDAADNKLNSFDFDGVTYHVYKDKKTNIISTEYEIAIAMINIFGSYKEADFENVATYDFKLASSLALIQERDAFTVGNDSYTIEADETEFTILDSNGNNYAEVSDMIVNPNDKALFLSVDFKSAVRTAIKNHEENFNYTHEDGETIHYTIERVNDTFHIKKDTQTELIRMYEFPAYDHPLGLDNNGMDIMTRLMYGGQVSLLVGFVVIIIEVFIGIIIGGVSGYFGGWVDTALMRFVDLFNSIPFIPLVLIFGSVMDALDVDPMVRIYLLMAMLGLLGWTGIARIVRGQILSLRELDFMVSAEATGIRTGRKIFRHLIPNIMPLLIVTATAGLGGIIITEATLGFLGLGVKYPLASWGSIINVASDAFVMTNYWFMWMPAGGLILLTVLGFNFVGDGLRDAFDPKMKR